MITSLLAVALLSAPPSEAYPVPAPSAPGGHTARAHTTLVAEVKDKLVPDLRAYKSLSDDLVTRLAFMDQVADAVDTLDRIRKSGLTRAIENTVPGFGWLTTTWDELRELAERTEKVRTHMGTLRKVSEDLLAQAERYNKAPDSDRLETLLLGYQDAELTFRAASHSFGELLRFIDKLSVALKRSRAIVEKLSGLPLIGGRVKDLAGKIDELVRGLGLVREVLKLAVAAIERDRAYVASIRGVLSEAEAHDAYDAAETMQADGRPGSALVAYQAIHVRWPDTQWAHRADRKIVEAVGAIDALEQEVAKLRQDVVTLREATSRAQAAEARALDAARPRPPVAPAQPPGETADAPAQPPDEPRSAAIWWIVLAAVLVAGTAGAVVLRRRTSDS